jgi:hypothetical protein
MIFIKCLKSTETLHKWNRINGTLRN